MKLKLKNFRCYLEKEIDFGSDGVVLLSGQSGVGKTTLLLAINFCLYGTGTKVTSFGKTGCSVVFEIKDLKVTRTKRPNRLVVEYKGKKYEDLEAQGIIDNLYGKCFETTCYLQQNALKSFILMSASDKLEFLEKFALNGIDLEKIKKRCYATIKARNEQLISTTSRLEMTEKHFETLTKPDLCEFPVKCKPSQREKYIQNHQIKLKNNDLLLRKTEKKISILTERKNGFILSKSQRENLEKRNDDIKVKLEKLNKRLKEVNFSEKNFLNLQRRLSSLLKQKEKINLKTTLEQNRKRLTEIELQDLNERSSEIQILNSQLYQQGSQEEISATIELIEKGQKIVAIYESVLLRLKNRKEYTPSEQLRQDLEQLRQDLEQLELYQCPKCQTSLKFMDGFLVETDLEIHSKQPISEPNLELKKGAIEAQIIETENLLEKSKKNEALFSELSRQIISLEEEYSNVGFEIDEKTDKLPSSDDLKEELKNLHEYLASQSAMEKRILTLEKGGKSSVVRKLEKELKTMEELYATFPVEEIEVSSEENLRREIEKETEKKTVLEYLVREQRELANDLVLVERELEKNKPTEDPTADLDSEISKKTELLSQRNQLEEISKKLQEFSGYSTALIEYENWERKVKTLGEEEILLRKLYSASTLLKEKILEAESIAIMNVVESINLYSQEYLDLFFPDNPIIVRLMPFKVAQKDKGKEHAKSRPQITVEIDYKGNPCDLSSLSGGELARVILAYTLALCEIFNAPLLMLDECTASLDQELAGVVMEGIRNRFREKLVIVIAHQCVTGDFDRHVQM